MTDYFFQFYTRPVADAVEAVIVVNDVEVMIVVCPSEAEALAVIEQLVEVGLELHGGQRVYSREQRN